jgi:hypothetical protein
MFSSLSLEQRRRREALKAAKRIVRTSVHAPTSGEIQDLAAFILDEQPEPEPGAPRA